MVKHSSHFLSIRVEGRRCQFTSFVQRGECGRISLWTMSNIYLFRWAIQKKKRRKGGELNESEKVAKLMGRKRVEKVFLTDTSLRQKEKEHLREPARIFSLHGSESVCSQAEGLISRSMALFRLRKRGCCLAQIS